MIAPMRPSRLWLALLLAACGSHHHGGDAGFGSLEVDPPLANLTVQLGGTATQDYTVYSVEGTKKTDVTMDCTLTVDPSFGTFTAATLTATAHGGKTNVTATCGTATGTSELVVNLTGTIVVAGAPSGAAATFGSATLGTDPTRAPPIQYPLDKAVSPRNIPPIEIQWAPAGNDLYHVALASSFLAVDVYTIDVQETLAAADWESIASSAAGDTLQITVEGLAQASPATKYAGSPVAIGMSQDIIDRTAIYYWASSKGDIMSQTFGDVTAPSVVDGNCTA